MSKITLTIIALVFGLFLLMTRTEAIAQEEPVVKMEHMIVTGTGEKTPTQYVQDIVPQIEIKQPRISGSIIDTLMNKAGVQLRQSAFNSSESGKLRLRGFDETRLKILKDGVPINRDGSYGNGPVDWRILSGDTVERIEIHRGAGPAKFGDTLGGVINIVTRQPDKTPITTASSVFGSLGTWDSKIFHAMKTGSVGWSLSAGHFEADGYLRNNFDNRNHFSGDLFFELPAEIRLGTGITYSDSECGYPVYNRPDSRYFKSGDPTADEKEIGGPGITSRLLAGPLAWGDDTRAGDENLALTAFAEKEFSTGRFRTDIRVWNQERREVYYAAENKNKKIYERTTDAEDNNWLWKAESMLHFGEHHMAAGAQMKRYGWGDQAVDYIDETYFNGSINAMTFVKEGFEGQPDLLSYYAFYLQDQWCLNKKLSLEAGLRSEWFHADSVDPDAFGYDWETAVQEMDENHLDPRISIVGHAFKNSRFTATIGMTHRYPTSPEYFWWYLNNSTNFFNTSLHAEEALQYELAMEQRLRDQFHIGLRAYYYDVEDYISGTTVPRIGQVKYNIGEVTIKGVEFSLAADLPHNIQPWVNATWQEGEKDDDPWDTDNQLTDLLPDLPEIMINAGVDYRFGDRGALRLWLNHVGEREHFKGDSVETLKAYTLVNFSATYQIRKNSRTRWELLLSGENIFNESYEQKEGYPMPDAMFIGGLRLNL